MNLNRLDKVRSLQAGEWCARLLPASPYQAEYVAASSTIGFAFDGQTGVHAYASDRIRPFRAKPDSLAFVPEGCDVFSESGLGGEYLCLSSSTSDNGVVSTDGMFNNILDVDAARSARFIRKLLLCPEYADPMLVEHHAQILADCANTQLAKKPAAVVGSAITASKLNTIDELIDVYLADGLTVAFLANAVGVSPGYFSRVFRATVGKTPFDYVIDRRVSRARQLISSGANDFSAVALASGFSSHAHMTETFRQRIGLSPTQLRKSVSGKF